MVMCNNIIDRLHKLLDVGDSRDSGGNRSTDFTPNMMLLGREVMMPLDFMLGSDGEKVGRGSTFGAEKQGKYWEASKGDRKGIMI